MNLHSLPIGHWVIVRDPRGREGAARHYDPVVPFVRRVNAARMAKKAPKERDLEVVWEWLDARQDGQLVLFPESREKPTLPAA